MIDDDQILINHSFTSHKQNLRTRARYVYATFARKLLTIRASVKAYQIHTSGEFQENFMMMMKPLMCLLRALA